MRIEHLAFNVRGAAAMVEWYSKHLHMPIHVVNTEPIYVAFFGETPSVLEVYDNPDEDALDFKTIPPAAFHLAFYSDDLEEDSTRLCSHGATQLDGAPDKNGYGLMMLRCPWGLPIQLCRRKEPLF